MRCSIRGQVVILLSILVLVVGASGCASYSLTPAGKLVTASDAQFSLPPSVAVTSGSSGLESSGTKDEHWWLTSDQAEITVSNNSKHSPTMEVTATVVPPPCPGLAELVVDSPGSPRIRLVVGSAGKFLALRLDVQPGRSKTIHVSVLTPVCHISTDPRSFYAGLSALKAQPPQAVEMRDVKGLSGNQADAPAASLNWLIAPEAEMAVTHNSGPSTKLKLTGFAIPPPCPGSTAQVTVELPGSPAVRLDTGTSATAIAIAFAVPIGTTKTVKFIVKSPSCRIAGDSRTFFAGLTKLEVSAG